MEYDAKENSMEKNSIKIEKFPFKSIMQIKSIFQPSFY